MRLECVLKVTTAADEDWLMLWQLIQPAPRSGYGCMVRKVPQTTDTASATIFQSSISGEAGSPWTNPFISPLRGEEHPYVEAMVATAEYFYWISEAGDIGRALINGSEPDAEWLPRGTVLVAEGDEGRGLWADATYLYWLVERSGGGGYIGRCKLDGTEVVNELVTATGAEPERLAGDGEHLYWTRAPGGGALDIGRSKLDGTETNATWLAVAGTSRQGGLVVVGEYVYYGYAKGAPEKPFIGRIKSDGTGSLPEWKQVGEAVGTWPWYLGYDGTYLVWDSGLPSGRTWINRMKPDGTEMTLDWIEAPLEAEALNEALTAAPGFIYVFNALEHHILRYTEGESLAASGIETVNSEGGEYNPAWLTDPEREEYALVDLEGYVYFLSTSPTGEENAIGRITVTKAGYEPAFYAPGVPVGRGPNALTTDGTYLYWVQGPEGAYVVMRATPEELEANEATEVVSLSSETIALACGGGHLYWMSVSGHIGRWPLGGGEPEGEWAALAFGTNEDKGLAADDTDLYVSGVGTFQTSLGRITIAGVVIDEEWVVGAEASGPVALDTRYVYYGHSGKIGRVNKNGSELRSQWLSRPAVVNSRGLTTAPLAVEESGNWEVRLVKRLGGESLLASALVEMGEGEHNLAFDVDITTGDLAGSVDGTTVVTSNDTQFKGGFLGMEASSSTGGIAATRFTFEGKVLDPLEREEDPLT